MAFQVSDGKIENPESLEINVAHHCNLSCRACSHLSPILPRTLADPEEVHASLSVLAKSYHAAGCKLLGGEPLLHPALLEIADAVRATGIADKILVCTNGLLLPRMSPAFWDKVDAVLVSHYPGGALDSAEYPRLSDLAREHGTDFQVYYFDHFRESYSETGTHSPGLAQRIYNACKIAHLWSCHTVHQGYFFKCPQSAFLELVLDAEERRLDGLRIEDSPAFREALLAYLNAAAPLRSCSRCLGTVGQRFEHEQTRRRDWRGSQDRSTEELVDPEYLALSELDIEADDGCVRQSCPVPAPVPAST